MSNRRRLRLRSRVKRDRAATLRRLAAALGLQVRAVELAAKVRGFPVASDGTYDLATVRAWFRARARASRRRGGPSLLGDFESDQTRLYGGPPLTAAERYGPPESEADDGAAEDISESLAAYRRARAERERLTLIKLKSELISRAEVIEMTARWARAFGRALDALDGRVAHLLTVEQRAAVRQEHQRVLAEFVRSARAFEDGQNAGDT